MSHPCCISICGSDHITQEEIQDETITSVSTPQIVVPFFSECNLPHDIRVYIVSFLSAQEDLLHIGAASKSWRKASAKIWENKMLDLSYKKLSFATYKALSQGIFPHIRLSSVEMRNKDVLLLISAKKQTRQWHQAFLASFGLLHKQSLSLSTTRSQGNVLSGCSSSCIRTLILENNHISAKSIQALRTLSALTILDLSNNSLSFREIKALASVLKDAPITHLNLSHNCIKDKGTIALAEAFKERTSIAELSLSHNNITDIGAIALAHTLKAETTITTLNLNVNWIGVEGATAIADALKKMTSTVTLNLSYNPIEGAGQSVLDDLKRSRPSLTIYY